MLAQPRATFGEEVALNVEIVNDKLLPLTWLHVEDEVPAGLTIRGGGFHRDLAGGRTELHLLLPMLPFQRVRRRLTVVCDQRGQQKFGPARVHSGDPVGLHQYQARVSDVAELLVYPKMFRLATPSIVSRVPWGDQRAAPEVAGDPEPGGRRPRVPAGRRPAACGLAGDRPQQLPCWSGSSSPAPPGGLPCSPTSGSPVGVSV